jgi:pimeloyl-ACP methyl ester carboxylesterase
MITNLAVSAYPESFDGRVLDESVPPPASPEQPPLAPYDPPQPDPQAAAWQRALRVVADEPLRRMASTARTRTGRSWSRPLPSTRQRSV